MHGIWNTYKTCIVELLSVTDSISNQTRKHPCLQAGACSKLAILLVSTSRLFQIFIYQCLGWFKDSDASFLDIQVVLTRTPGLIKKLHQS